MLELIRNGNVTSLVSKTGSICFSTLQDSEDEKRCSTWARHNNQVFLPEQVHQKSGKGK